MLIKFEKLQGTGNDFILIDNTDKALHLQPETIASLCDRHFGIGSDGLILIEKNNDHYYMNYFNADGNSAEMCGNGMRCSAFFISDHFLNSDVFSVDSKIGLVPAKLDGKTVSIEMPIADFDPESVHFDQDIGLEPIYSFLKENNIDLLDEIGLVSMGNPHCILFVEELDNIVISKIGSYIETHPAFKEDINVNFVQKLNDSEIKIITWERGDGLTLACGTGSCATVSYLNKNGHIDKKVKVNVPGGILDLTLNEDHIDMSGEVKKVFKGEVEV